MASGSVNIAKKILENPMCFIRRGSMSEEFFRQYPELRPELFVEHMGEELAIKLKSTLQGETLESATIRAPADWLEAVKERFFPKFLLKHCPVKYKEQTLEIRAVYPKLSLPREEHKLIFLVNNHPVWKK